jgi:hypothetical protein
MGGVARSTIDASGDEVALSAVDPSGVGCVPPQRSVATLHTSAHRIK